VSEKFSHSRVKNWAVHMAKFITASRRDPQLRLDWVNAVCCSWAGECVETITGVNPYAEFAHVNSPAKASQAIRNAGYQNLEELMYDRFYEIPKHRGQRGDLCIIEAEPQVIFDIEVIPVAVGVIEPPFYWVVGETGLCKGLLASPEVKACFMVDNAVVRGIISEEEPV
jgi:hypothetical protein